jgi:signal-transduction protein with cAMP-binding, CBS, and nucleotidyltransferase domain
MPTVDLNDEIRKIAPFDRLSSATLARLIPNARVATFPRQGVLLAEGSRRESILVLREGIARISVGEVLVDIACGASVLALAGRSMVARAWCGCPPFGRAA